MKKQLVPDFCIPKNTLITFKEMGNVFEICYQNIVNKKILIKKLNDNEYVFLPTGEIRECKHIQNRSQNLFQVSQSLKRLRDYINTNVVEPKNCKWITLTYAENMQDTKRLYKDFEKFIKRLRYNFNEYNIEYIVAMEPQGRGAWHAHLILIFDRKAPYISNKTIQELWRQGFTKTKKLNDIDNIGAYLTAYLGDIEFTSDNVYLLLNDNLCNHLITKDVFEIDGKKLKEPKKFIKGGRLYFYPPKFNLYRISKGIKKPKTLFVDYEQAIKKIGSVKPTYKTTIKLSSDVEDTFTKDFEKIISYEFYNIKRVIPQNKNFDNI